MNDAISLSVYINFFVAMFAIVNPVGMMPIFITLTQDQTLAERNRTGLMACLAVGVILLVSMLLGQSILTMFGISLDSFRVAGGALIILIALSMLQAQSSDIKHTREEDRESVRKENVAVVPLAMPIMAGPGAMSSVIVMVSDDPANLIHYGAIGVVILALVLVSILVFRAAPLLSRILGTTGLNVITRIMGLILFAIGVEFIANGVGGLFPTLIPAG